MAVQLLEREADLAVLDDSVTAAARGGGSFVLISGEAGIGKTSLLRAFVDRLDGDIRVLSGACDDLATPRTLGPFHDMAQTGAKSLRDALHSGERSELFPAVLAELDDPLSTVVVTIEDVHSSDDGTLDVLRFLARRLESIRGLVVLTYRSDEIDEHHGLRGVLAALSGATTHRINLQGLSRQALDTLTRDADISPDALLAVTGGNPFYVTEVLASDEAGVPPTVADAVLARITHLSPRAQAALQLLAVIPSHVDAWLVDELVEHAPEVVVEAEVRGLLHVSAERVSFRHELARRALETSLPSAAALQHHRRVLAALQRRGDLDVARILHHAVVAGTSTSSSPTGRPLHARRPRLGRTARRSRTMSRSCAMRTASTQTRGRRSTKRPPGSWPTPTGSSTARSRRSGR